jgi:hypothetical protein
MGSLSMGPFLRAPSLAEDTDPASDRYSLSDLTGHFEPDVPAISNMSGSPTQALPVDFVDDVQ